MSEEIPFVAVGNDELGTKMIWSECPDCGGKIWFPIGELIWCANDETRPRPKCPSCGHVTSIERVEQ